MKPTERKGLIIASTLHLAALVWLIVATFFWHASANDEVVVFDVMPGPKAPFEIPGEKAPGPINGKKPGSPAKGDTDLPDLKAPKIPEAVVEPNEPESEPESAPPPPKPSPKPTPKPLEKKTEAQVHVSYEEFLKNSKEGERIKKTSSTVSKSNSKKTSGLPSVKIDKSGLKNLGKMIVADGEGGGGGGSADSKGVGMRMGGGGNASALNSYMASLKARIDAGWDKPDDASGSGISAEVSFTVGKNGLITARRITKSSGSSTFDQSILNVFDRLGYVGTPPGGAKNFSLTFSLDE